MRSDNLSLRVAVSIKKRSRLDIDIELVDMDTTQEILPNCRKKMKFDNLIVNQAKELLKLFLSYYISQCRFITNIPYFPSFSLPPSMTTLNNPLLHFAQQISYQIRQEEKTFVFFHASDDEEKDV